MTSLPFQPVLDPSNTTLLVTGASGYIAGHIIQEALDLGYTVRGTARTEAKAESTKKVHANHPRYSTVIVSDFGKPGAELDEAVKGVDAICHVASDTTFSEDVDQVVTTVVNATVNILKAASKEPSVKRVVLTSSSSAALTPKPNVDQTASIDSWNDEAVDVAFNRKGQSIAGNSYAFLVYAASKTEGEKAFWKFVKEEKPHFVANSVLPNFNSGRILPGASTGITAQMVIDLFQKGEKAPLPPQYYIDVKDDARLHIIPALLDGSIENQRIYAFAAPFNWGQVIDVIHKVRPDVKAKLEKDANEGKDISKVPNEVGAELLKKWFHQEGYTGLEESIKQNLEGY